MAISQQFLIWKLTFRVRIEVWVLFSRRLVCIFSHPWSFDLFLLHPDLLLVCIETLGV